MIFKNNSRRQQKHEKLPSMQKVSNFMHPLIAGEYTDWGVNKLETDWASKIYCDKNNFFGEWYEWILIFNSSSAFQFYAALRNIMNSGTCIIELFGYCKGGTLCCMRN